MNHSDGNTPQGKMPPMEVAKTIAFEKVLASIEKHLGKSSWDLLGQSRAAFTAKHVSLKGGGHPGERRVKRLWETVKKDPKWFVGKGGKEKGGRPPQITLAQKQAIADKAMELKEDLVAPTPERVRALLPRKAINKATSKPISDFSIRKVFHTMCYDENEDDPWQYMNALQQDCLTEEMKPRRVQTAKHIIENITPTAAFNFVAIDPCFSMLPKKEEKAELIKIAAMGNKKWMSPKSRRKGSNLRAPATAKTQKESVTIVHWTPVFTRGRLKLVVLTAPGSKLNNSAAAAAFVKDELPDILEDMKKEWEWSSIPRVLMHDKASYFVNSKQHCLNQTFATGLQAGNFKSWVDSHGGDCRWMAKMLGDLFLHETVISHVRRLLQSQFARKSLHETPGQFAARMKKVEHYMNNVMGKSAPGEALMKLGRALHNRSEDLKDLNGERLPKYSFFH